MTSGRSSAGSAANQRPAASACWMAELGQRHVDVADVDVDVVQPGFMRGVARDIALALPVPDQPQALGPILPHSSLLPGERKLEAADCVLKWRAARSVGRVEQAFDHMVLDDRARARRSSTAGQMVADLRRRGGRDRRGSPAGHGDWRWSRRARSTPTTSTGRGSVERLAVPRWMVSAERAEMSPRCGSLRHARARCSAAHSSLGGNMSLLAAAAGCRPTACRARSRTRPCSATRVDRGQVERQRVEPPAAASVAVGRREVAVPRLVLRAGAGHVEADLDDLGSPGRAPRSQTATNHGCGGDVDEAADAARAGPRRSSARARARSAPSGDGLRFLEQARRCPRACCVGPGSRLNGALERDDAVAVEAAHDGGEVIGVRSVRHFDHLRVRGKLSTCFAGASAIPLEQARRYARRSRRAPGRAAEAAARACWSGWCRRARRRRRARPGRWSSLGHVGGLAGQLVPADRALVGQVPDAVFLVEQQVERRMHQVGHIGRRDDRLVARDDVLAALQAARSCRTGNCSGPTGRRRRWCG